MTFRTRPRKENRRSRLSIFQIGFSILTVIIFWREIWFLILWLFNRFTPPDNAPSGLEISDAWQTLVYVLLIIVMAFLLLLIYLSRRGAYPLRNLDEIAARIPADNSYDINNPHNQAEPYVLREEQIDIPPIPKSLTFNPPYLRETLWDWIFPRKNKPDEHVEGSSSAGAIDNRQYNRAYASTISRNLREHLRDSYRGFWHQFRWFFGGRGVNAVIQKGEIISTGTGKPYASVRGFVISDFDGTYLLDASQNGQRTGQPPQVGWFGMQRVSRTKVLQSASLGRISKFEKDVHAYTADGIEIMADVTGVFNLGQRPRGVDVSYTDPNHPHDSIYSLKLNKDRQTGDFTFEADHDQELDEQDRRYIANRIDSLQQNYGEQDYQQSMSQHDFEFDPERVVRAMTSRPLTSKGEEGEWQRIVLEYAKDIFQRTILNYTFNELFENSASGKENTYKLDDIVEEVQWQVVRDGMLTFRLFWAKNEEDKVGRVQDKTRKDDESTTYTEKQIGNAPTVPQQSSFSYRVFNNGEQLPAFPPLDNFDTEQKYLRSRGIRVMAAVFENVRPKMPEIDETRIHQWSSSMQKQIDEQRAAIEQQHAEIMSKAIAETQEDVIDQLLLTLQSDAPEEVALLQFLSSLEEMTNREDDEGIGPKDFHNIISELRQWVMGGKK